MGASASSVSTAPSPLELETPETSPASGPTARRSPGAASCPTICAPRPARRRATIRCPSSSAKPADVADARMLAKTSPAPTVSGWDSRFGMGSNPSRSVEPIPRLKSGGP
ncbi:hypothetical protein ACFPRL_21395 [Pseudoclavibacter helvolus]